MTIETVILALLVPIFSIALGIVWKKANENCKNLTSLIEKFNAYKLEASEKYVKNTDFDKLEKQVSEIHDIVVAHFGTIKKPVRRNEKLV